MPSEEKVPLRALLPDVPKIVVFVDDLDRCTPDKAIDVLESIKLVLCQPAFSFVLGMAHRIIHA